MRKPSLGHRAEYVLMRAAESALARLSRGVAEAVGSEIGSLVRRPLGIRLGVVRDNLRLAFPEADDTWIEQVTIDSYRHLGREAVAMLRLSGLDRAAIREVVEIPESTWEAYLEARAEGRGVILATGHYGNWEMAAAGVAARGVPIEAIVKRQSNLLVDARITRARESLGVEPVDMASAPRRIPRSLLSGKSVGIVADQDARQTGVWVPFFGVPASSHRGPASFALRVRAPLFSAVARRIPDGRYLLTAERIDTTPSGNFEEDVLRVTAALARHLETEIRLDPPQYFWFHKRWKTRPMEEPDRLLTGTT